MFEESTSVGLKGYTPVLLKALFITAGVAPLSILHLQVTGKLLLVMTLRDDLKPAVKQIAL